MKVNTYVVNAYDTDGDTLLENVRFTARDERRAWMIAVEKALAVVATDHRQGVLSGILGMVEVTRL